MIKKINIIVAVCNNNGIGINNNLPWNLKSDLKYFKELTSKTKDSNKINAIIMGKNTYNSIGHKLPNRLNIILSKTMDLNEDNLITIKSIDECINYINTNNNIEKVYCIGGESIYNEFIKLKQCESIYITKIYKKYICDSFFPEINDTEWHLTSCSNFNKDDNIYYRNYLYTKYGDVYKNKEEIEYLKLMETILEKGEQRKTRNAIVRSIFGTRSEYDISDHLPLLTTKKIFLRGIIEELLWFIKGDTNSKNLNNKGVKIWNGNSSRNYLDSIGLNHLNEGDCGPIYGHQWRHFGAEYKTCEDNYENEGYDQLKECINLINNNSTSRRIILNAWNPNDLNKMALPPCHILYQWYVSKDKELSCQFYQRSSDYFIANNFNIVSASILTYMIAHICNLKPKKVIMCIGDTHIYDDHIMSAYEQLKNPTLPFPKLIIKNKINNIEDFKYEDFKLIDYNYNNVTKVNMIV